ncbi:MAG TPA: tetratricopeptide repeat protein, partial [Salinimicrobium sp.]|nr:tetratricopeptide repeat protein [Salinimicrobium sp.]
MAFLLCFFFLVTQFVAQEEEAIFADVSQDAPAVTNDAFQENFFEALKQKAIENHEKAIESLFKCLEIDPKPVVYFELGKNYNELERSSEAIRYFEKARQLEPKNEAVLTELYHTYFLNQQFREALPVVKDLVAIDPHFSEDLANLYILNQQYEPALQLLNQLDKKGGGNSDFRDGLRRQIYDKTNNTGAKIADLEEKITEDPQAEENYLNLIFVYSEEGKTEEAFELAKKLEAENPHSELVHLALYKFYLEENSSEKAMESMKILLSGNAIDQKTKYKVLNDFLLKAAEDPSLESNLLKIVEIFAVEAESAEVFEKIGDFFLGKQQKEQALEYFQKGLQNSDSNYGLIMKTLPLLQEFQKYEEAKVLIENAIENYPSQPLLYLENGRILNQLT